MLANEALTSMVPEEMLGVLKETLSHVAQDVPRALEMGTKLIVSPTSRLYFDRPQGDASLPIDTQYEEVRFGFNKSVLTGLLCDQLRFDGTVCTDWGLITDNEVMQAKAWGVEHLTQEEQMLKILDAGAE